MKWFVLLISAIILTLFALLLMRVLARLWKLERTNFRGDRIPTGYGFVLFLAAVPAHVGLLILRHGGLMTELMLAVVAGFGILGLVDDVFGDRRAGGFRGHFGLLLQGKLSTGLMKAVLGGLIALVIGSVLSHGQLLLGVVNGLIIGLSANLLNLLDLRPGRAVCYFWVGIGVLLPFIRVGGELWVNITTIAVPAIALTALDRSAKVMMGDAGSNTLGAVLGLFLVCLVGLPVKLILLAYLIVVHVYAEKRSISKLIEENHVLSSLDGLLGER